jgi:hypothetical protein
VPVRTRHVDPARNDPFSVGGLGGGEGTGAVQDAWKCADALGGEMVHHQHRGREVGREVRHQLHEGRNAPGRESYDYDVAP